MTFWTIERSSIARNDRIIYSDDTHCLQCQKYHECWMDFEVEDINELKNIMPECFYLKTRTNKSEWSWAKFLTYYQGIIATLCNNFVNTNPEAERKRQEAEYKKQQEEAGFDL